MSAARLRGPGVMWLLISMLLAATHSYPEDLQSLRVRDDSLSVTHLANAGFLIHGHSGGVLIDAFVEHPYSTYAALSVKDRNALQAAEEPFGNIVIALASHVHRDHFQPALAARFLASADAASIFSTPQVIEALLDHDQSGLLPESRLRTVWPDSGSYDVSVSGVHVAFIPLRHGSTRNYGVQNLGHIVSVDGKNVVHLGDAEMIPEHFARHNLTDREIDIALVPYWFLLSDAGKNIVYNHIGARHIIAMHIPPDDAEDILRQLEGIDPHVLVAVEAGQAWRF